MVEVCEKHDDPRNGTYYCGLSSWALTLGQLSPEIVIILGNCFCVLNLMDLKLCNVNDNSNPNKCMGFFILMVFDRKITLSSILFSHKLSD